MVPLAAPGMPDLVSITLGRDTPAEPRCALCGSALRMFYVEVTNYSATNTMTGLKLLCFDCLLGTAETR